MGRAILIVLSNVLGGALLGSASVFAYWIVPEYIATFAGAVFAIVFLPATTQAMMFRSIWQVWLLLYLPTTIVAISISFFVDPAISFVGTTGMFIAMLIAIYKLLPENRPSPSQCVHCSYDLRATTTGTCPECGNESTMWANP